LDIKDIPVLAPWLAGLPFFQKVIVSIVVILIASFILALVWAKPPADEATQAILSGCYRHALFTRMHAQLSVEEMHAQLSVEDMFRSIDECRKILQTNIPKMKSKDQQAIAVQLLVNVEGIGRLNPPSYEDAAKINAMKLQALHNFRELANLSGGSYPLSDKLGEAVYFTQQEADAPLSEEDIATGKQVPNSK
jgi:hypothetical protein